MLLLNDLSRRGQPSNDSIAFGPVSKQNLYNTSFESLSSFRYRMSRYLGFFMSMCASGSFFLPEKKPAVAIYASAGPGASY